MNCKTAFKYVFSALLCILLSIILCSCNAGVIVNEHQNITVINQSQTVEVLSEAETSAAEETAVETETASEITSTTKAETEKTTAETTAKSTTAKQAETTVTRAPAATDITTEAEATTAADYCTVTIDCRVILDNMDMLKDGHESYVPSNGYLLNHSKVKYQKGDTAYDILKRACGENGIKLNAKSTQYGTYVAGIGELDEFDCGKESGWLYAVNGTKPGISCGKFNVNAGDTIEFIYTVKI